MGEEVLFGTLPQKEVARMFQLPRGRLHIDFAHSSAMVYALRQVINEPYGRFMLSNRRALHGTSYQFIFKDELIGDEELMTKYCAGISFAWHLMGKAWVAQLFQHFGAIYATYFLAETYEQFHATYYNYYVKPVKDPQAQLPVIDSYIVTLLANIELCLPEEAVVLMGSMLVHFMQVPIRHIQILRQRADEIVSKMNIKFTIH